MKADYVKAIETRLRWAREVDESKESPYWKEEFHSAHGNSEIAHQLYGYALENADTYFMNKHFCEMVDQARDTVPDNLAFDVTWPQSKDGWLWLEKPATLPFTFDPPLHYEFKLTAIGWLRANTSPEKKPQYHIMCFGTTPDGSFCPVSNFPLTQGDELLPRIRSLNSDFNSVQGAFYPPGHETDIKHEARWVYCALYLMAQKLAHHSRVEPDRATRRRLADMNPPVKPPIIRVVSLRRLEQDRPKEKTTSQPVEWQWQWIVSGFWRDQYYPSLKTWKPKWIEDYVKGPEDKPLKPPGLKLFVARR